MQCISRGLAQVQNGNRYAYPKLVRVTASPFSRLPTGDRSVLAFDEKIDLSLAFYLVTD